MVDTLTVTSSKTDPAAGYSGRTSQSQLISRVPDIFPNEPAQEPGCPVGWVTKQSVAGEHTRWISKAPEQQSLNAAALREARDELSESVSFKQCDPFEGLVLRQTLGVQRQRRATVLNLHERERGDISEAFTDDVVN